MKDHERSKCRQWYKFFGAIRANQNIVSFSIFKEDINVLIVGSNENQTPSIETGCLFLIKASHSSNKSTNYMPTFIPHVAIPK